MRHMSAFSRRTVIRLDESYPIALQIVRTPASIMNVTSSPRQLLIVSWLMLVFEIGFGDLW